YQWPGNIRELENLVERIVITAKQDNIQISDLPEEFRSISTFEEGLFSLGGDLTLTERTQAFEKELIRQALQLHGSTRKAAAALGITQSLLMRRIGKYQLRYQQEEE
ncbi:hypothetical protein MXD81_13635, partial [Microbacteriaceae bacterium K1510]|nr:hypothetical protein [Microbacteriaceae bacterium K1510]